MDTRICRLHAQGDIRIETSAIQGVTSEGMLCSAAELGLADDAAGLYELDADADPGTDFRSLLGLDDPVIDVSLTPNRGDCLGLHGLAREVAVINNLDFEPPAVAPVRAAIDDAREIRQSDPGACPRYCGRVVRGIDAGRPTPLWVVERLRRSGVRSINIVVDLTNYVMLECGQPMHAFDLAKLQAYRTAGVNRLSFGVQWAWQPQWSLDVGFDTISQEFTGQARDETSNRLRFGLTYRGLSRAPQ